MPSFLSLFAGVGGFDLGLERAGFRCVGQVEIDRACQRVLGVRWPGVWRWTDVRGVFDPSRCPAGEDSIAGCQGEGAATECGARDSEGHQFHAELWPSPIGHGIRGEDRAEWPGAPGIDRAAVESAERAHRQRRLGTVDLLVGGFPCQGASVAGKRRGLKDDRTALFWEIIRVGKALRPPFLLLENVPGLLSVNGGEDIGAVLDALHGAGWLTEVEECDSQEFGVPQRRRRLFFVGVDANYGLQTPTHFSSVTLAAVVAQSLLDAWELLDPRSVTVSGDCGGATDQSSAIAGLRRRMASFAASLEASAWPRLLSVLDARARASASAPSSWACPSDDRQDGLSQTATSCAPATDDESDNTVESWSVLWGDLWIQPSASTISIWSKQTTPQQICTCAEATLSIFVLTAAWTGSCPPCWNAKSLSLTALLACIASLEPLADDLFVEEPWRDRARILLAEAESRARDAVCGPDEARVAQILFEPARGDGDLAASGEAGARIAASIATGANRAGGARRPGTAPADADNLVIGVDIARALGGIGGGQDYGANKGTLIAPHLAATLSSGSHGSGVNAPGRRQEDDENLVAATLCERDAKGPDSNTKPGHLIVTHTLRAEGHDASEDGTGRGVPMVCFDPTTSLDQAPSDATSPPLKVGSGLGIPWTPAIAFDTTQITTFDTFNDLSDALTMQGFAASIHAYADATQADADSILRLLREAIDSRDGARRAASVLAPFLPSQVLRHGVHGARVQGPVQDHRNEPDGGAVSSTHNQARGPVRGVRNNAQASRRTSSRREFAEQRSSEPHRVVPLLPSAPAPEDGSLLDMWEPAEGARLLRQALSAIQEVGRSASVQAQSTQPALAVRRLVPAECEALQGFPIGWTCLCLPLDDWARDPEAAAERCTCPDSPRYRMMGNAVTVPVIEWLGRRLMAALTEAP